MRNCLRIKKTMETSASYGVLAGPVPDARTVGGEAKGKGKPTTKAAIRNLRKWYWKTLIRVTAGGQQKDFEQHIAVVLAGTCVGRESIQLEVRSISSAQYKLLRMYDQWEKVKK